jgi:hypothetical protein
MPGDALHQQAGVLINENSHWLTPFADGRW